MHSFPQPHMVCTIAVTGCREQQLLFRFVPETVYGRSVVFVVVEFFCLDDNITAVEFNAMASNWQYMHTEKQRRRRRRRRRRRS